MSDDWELPVPREDPEVCKAGLARDDEGRVRVVPGDNIVEGEIAEDGRKAPPSRPFSSS
jgi:hypothetical protein